ncbi:MAG: tetratricopeptide repeat protein [Terriglobales bacterium]|jgi:tetratricopeptide (TPR) repeat protein
MRILFALRSRLFRSRAIVLRAIIPGIILGVLLCSEPICALGQTSPSAPRPAANPDRLPITTSSPEAAKLFEEGLRLRYDYHIEQALVKWREAAIKDPHFAQAWTYIVWVGLDPGETRQAAEQAQLTSRKATPGEKLLVKWVVSTNQGRFLGAIAAMNDLLAMYPRDGQLQYEAGLWLQSQGDYEGAAKLTKRALEIDPNFAGALNTLAYDLAYMHEYDQAILTLKRYVEAEPNDPNPRDSLAEILQQAGRLEESLAEYREALKMDPQFFTSQLGLGNDYALLGNQDRARQEYAQALPMALTPQDKLNCQIQSAISYAREGNVKQARVELAAVLAAATKLQVNDYRGSIHRYLALLSESPDAAFQHLTEAEVILQGSGHVSGKVRSGLLARTLRTRARLAAEAGRLEMARAAVSRLQKMLQANRNNAVERAYHGANGALLAAESKIGAAIEELREDPEYPFSLSKLAELQAASGNAHDAAETRARLQADYGTTLEDWLVVRGFRQ